MIRPLGEAAAAMVRYGERLFQPPQDTIRGIDPGDWGSPWQPVEPFGPPGSEPQAFQIWPGQNLIFTPRPDAEYTSADLKALASYPLARICIENIKDIITSAPREIQVKALPGENKKDRIKRMQGDKDLIQLNRFFDQPSRENDWGEWARRIVDEMLVGDYVSVLVRKSFKGEVVELPPIHGAIINRYIDRNGWTPVPPSPAYAQLWWGIPRIDLTTDQLIYKPRNIVYRNTMTSMLYGYSQTEQLAPEIEIGIQRLAFVKAYYEEGSIPGVVQVVPRGTPTDKIDEAMRWMNSDLAGNLAKRRQWRLVQGWGEKPSDEKIEFTKEPLLSDPYDEKLMRTLAFGYGVSPQRLLKQMNRASAEQSDDAAEVEGTRPYFKFMKSLVDRIIQITFGYADYEIVFDPSREPDAEKQMKVITGYVKEGIITRNEGRDKIGEEPASEPEADQLMVDTATGPVPLGTAVEGAEADVANKKKQQAAPGDKPAGGKPNGKPASAVAAQPAKKPGGKEEGAKAFGFAGGTATAELELGKANIHHAPHGVVKAMIHPGKLEPQSILAKHKMEKILRDKLKRMERIAVRELRKAFGIATKGHRADLSKATDDEAEATQRIIDAFQKEWLDLARQTRQALEGAADAGAMLGALQLDLTSEDMLARVNAVAENWAADRAAEMVGMKQVDGELVENPDARWAISETTRDQIREVVKDLFAEEAPTLADIEKSIIEAGIFDDQRATMIARTEIARAQSQSNLLAWQESGLVLKVGWQTSADHSGEDECDDNEDGSPYDIDDVPEHPAHPNCECALVLEMLKGEEED